MFNWFKTNHKTEVITSPISGTVYKLQEGKDPVFAEGLMGPGCFIIPNEEGKLYAPCDGQVTSVFPTMHAYGLETSTGKELLIHIGVDTVKLNGCFFVSKVVSGQKISKGQLLVEFDFAGIKKRGLRPDVFLVLPNQKAGDLQVVYGALDAGDKLFLIAGSFGGE